MSQNESDDDNCFMGGLFNVIIAIGNSSKMNQSFQQNLSEQCCPFRGKAHMLVGLSSAAQMGPQAVELSFPG